MAENEAAVAEETEEAYQYQIKIEDAGPATKKVTVEIPKDRIEEVLTEQFKELRQSAAIPGFRPGHAPQKLIEKRFAGDVKEQVRRTLISESYQQAVEKNSLSVIGEPAFDNPEAIQLKEDEGLSYSFQVEVQPEFTVPDVSGLKVKKPKIEVTDENVQQAFRTSRNNRARWFRSRIVALKTRITLSPTFISSSTARKSAISTMPSSSHDRAVSPASTWSISTSSYRARSPARHAR